MGGEDAAKGEEQSKSKGEKGWARRQPEKAKKKFAGKWLVELQEQAKVSEVGKATGSWDKTPARHRFEEAKRLQGAKEQLQEATIGKIAS